VHLHLIRGSLGHHESAPRRHVDPLIRFCTTHRCERRTDKGTDTWAPTFLVSSQCKGQTPSFSSPSSYLCLLLSLSPPLISPPFKGRPIKQLGGRKGRSPSRQTIWCILQSTSAALVAAVFVDFPKNKCNFLHKNKLDIVRRVQLLTGRRAMRSCTAGAVAIIALCKSAPMDRQTDRRRTCSNRPRLCDASDAA